MTNAAKNLTVDPSSPLVFKQGTVIADRYRIEGFLNNGGMGSVFLAYDIHLERQVALKTIKTDLLEMEDRKLFMNRFKAEAIAAANLNHPNIIDVYDYQQIGELFFYVMRYIPNATTLHNHLAKYTQTFMPLSEIQQCFMQAALGLEEAHLKGIIHRDLKPDNMLVFETKTGINLKIIDFGVAHIPGNNFTTTRSIPGSQRYFSPEAIDSLRGKKVSIDHRMDLFALGMGLYRALTNQKPFSGETDLERFKAIKTLHPKIPTDIRPGIAKGWNLITMRLLEKNPEQRYANAGYLYEDLKNVEILEDELLPPKTPPSFVVPLSLEKSLPSIGNFEAQFNPAKNTPVPEKVNVVSNVSAAVEPAVEALDPEVQAYRSLKNRPAVKSRKLPKSAKLGLFMATGVVFLLLFTIFLAATGNKTIKKSPVINSEQLPKEKIADVTARDLLRDQDEAHEAQILTERRIRKEPERPQLQQSLEGTEEKPKAQKDKKAKTVIKPAAIAQNEKKKPKTSEEEEEEGDEEETFPEDGSDVITFYRAPEKTASTKESKTIGIPTGTTVRAKLFTGIALSNVSRTSPVTAVLPEPLVFSDTGELLPAGTQLFGQATSRMVGKQGRIEINFSRIVLPDHSERTISAMAMANDGAVGIAAKTTEKDSRAAANIAEGALDLVDKVLLDGPGSSITGRFSDDGRDDARELRQPSITLTVPKNTLFTVQFLRPL